MGFSYVYNSDGFYDVVDVFTGETVISGYKDYRYVNAFEDGIYMIGVTKSGANDVYRLTTK